MKTLLIVIAWLIVAKPLIMLQSCLQRKVRANNR